MSAAARVFDEEARNCPVCDAGVDQAAPFLERTFDPARLNAHSYASRKTPEFMTFELVSCGRCATVYASSAPSRRAVAEAYHEADYDSAEEAEFAARTYRDLLMPHLSGLASRGRALEIGTGSGVFLTALKQLGFEHVAGVEPSLKAIAAADDLIRPHIRPGTFVEGDFEPESFELICCFMTLEHVWEPRSLVESCTRLLRPGGLLALVTHNYCAAVNRLLGRRSPIIDIEHLQLFCPESLKYLVHRAGLEAVSIRSYSNRYPLQYWMRLAPLPRIIKSTLLRLRILPGSAMSFNVGNLFTVARKPD